jgi:hypothetical protein
MSVDVCTLIWLLFATGFTLKHARATWAARSACSVSLPATCFFTLYAAWSVFFFAWLNQPYSCAGSVLLLIAHAVWLALQIHFRERLPEPPLMELVP